MDNLPISPEFPRILQFPVCKILLGWLKKQSVQFLPTTGVGEFRGTGGNQFQSFPSAPALTNPGPKWPGIFSAVKLPAIGSKFEFNKFGGLLGILGFPMRHAFLEEPPTGRLLAHDLFQNEQFGQEISLEIAHIGSSLKSKEASITK